MHSCLFSKITSYKCMVFKLYRLKFILPVLKHNFSIQEIIFQSKKIFIARVNFGMDFKFKYCRMKIIQESNFWTQ